MTANTEAKTFLLGRSTTGAVHLSMLSRLPRCGAKNVYHFLDNHQGEADQITCKRCQQIAAKQLLK